MGAPRAKGLSWVSLKIQFGGTTCWKLWVFFCSRKTHPFLEGGDSGNVRFGAKWWWLGTWCVQCILNLYIYILLLGGIFVYVCNFIVYTLIFSWFCDFLYDHPAIDSIDKPPADPPSTEAATPVVLDAHLAPRRSQTLAFRRHLELVGCKLQALTRFDWKIGTVERGKNDKDII